MGLDDALMMLAEEATAPDLQRADKPTEKPSIQSN
jgi:hypothetical protein